MILTEFDDQFTGFLKTNLQECLCFDEFSLSGSLFDFSEQGDDTGEDSNQTSNNQLIECSRSSDKDKVSSSSAVSLPNNLKLILISDSSHTRSQHNSLVKKALKVSTKSRFQKTQTLMNKLPRTIQTIPRKVHVDYQSQCAQMLVNTMNTGMFPSFLSKYGRSKFLFNLVLDERNIPASIVHRPLPCNVEFNTLRETVAFWILYLSAHPDNICMMRKVYKRKCERNEGFTDDIREKLIIEFEMRFSRIVDVGPNDLARVVKMVAAMQEENGKSETNKIVKSHIHDGQLLAEMIMKMTAAGTLPGSTLLPTPIHYTMCGQFTLYLNSAKGIDGIRCFGYAVE